MLCVGRGFGCFCFSFFNWFSPTPGAAVVIYFHFEVYFNNKVLGRGVLD